jgi:serine/threonine-protein kinase HipA
VTTITAVLQLDEASAPVEVATLYSQVRRRVVTSSLRYADDYVALPNAYPLEPGLPVALAAQPVDGVLPRSWADAAPDRWGRTLIERRWRAAASASGDRAHDDRDYLLAVSDLTRQGALRFRRSGESAFLAEATNVPPLVELPRLLRASDAVVRDGDDVAAVKELLDAGTASLGGARPKASVRDGDTLHIAKFPRPGDAWNMMLWEAVALTIAARCGVQVPTWRLLPIDGRSVLVLERFDRVGARRLGYISALTLTQGNDGALGDYVTIAEDLAAHGADVVTDLRQLWLRIAVGIALHNTDDHLRNHGFLRERAGWRLAPAFDINPEPNAATRHATALAGRDDARGMAEQLIEQAAVFSVSSEEARAECGRIADQVSQWRDVAATVGASASEIERFGDAVDAGVAALRAASR